MKSLLSAVDPVDEVSLSIVALVVASMAIFAGLLQAGGPGLARSYHGHNPFTIKAAAINWYIEGVFVAIGLTGMFLQAGVYTFGDRIPDRSHSAAFYVWVFLSAVIGMTGVLFLARGAAAALAKKGWYPQLHETQSALYGKVVFAAEHDGLLEEFSSDVELSAARRESNDRRVASYLEQLEELFLGKKRKGSLQERVARLKRVFPD